MITVKDFNQLCKDIVSSTNIDGYVLVSTEEQAVNTLRDKEGIQLVAIYPTYSFSGSSADSAKPGNEFMFFMVLKPKLGAGYDVELEEYSDTQEAIIKFKDFIFEGNSNSPCRNFPEVDVNSVFIDPEFNVFGGFNGWSIKFATK